MNEKQTASNNRFLKNVKLLMNRKVFRETSHLLNEHGQERAQSYVLQFFRLEFRERKLAELLGDGKELQRAYKGII